MPLEVELATYESKLPELLTQEGKYVLIHQADVVGVYAAYEDALKEGYKQFGLAPFLVRQIKGTQQVQLISRLMDTPCHI
jgi:hypothetical protein